MNAAPGKGPPPFKLWPWLDAPEELRQLHAAEWEPQWVLLSEDGVQVRHREELLERLQASQVRVVVQERRRRQIRYFR